MLNDTVYLIDIIRVNREKGVKLIIFCTESRELQLGDLWRGP